MQNIPDKEFDELFKNQFEEAEIEPSSDLWGAIETKLEAKRKPAFPVYWIAAAVSVIGLTIGLLFYSSVGNQMGAVLAIAHRPAAKVDRNAVQDVTVSPQTVNSTVKKVAVSPVRVVSESFAMGKNQKKNMVAHSVNTVNHNAPSGSVKKDLIAMQPLKQIGRPDYKTITVKQEKMGLPPVPDEIVLASANVPERKDEVINENDQKENKGIRNVGDLVNFVVGKLDKREDKALQFQTDDDNSSLVGINIGMLKFKKQK